jgi:hypothetical protein
MERLLWHEWMFRRRTLTSTFRHKEKGRRALRRRPCLATAGSRVRFRRIPVRSTRCPWEPLCGGTEHVKRAGCRRQAKNKEKADRHNRPCGADQRSQHAIARFRPCRAGQRVGGDVNRRHRPIGAPHVEPALPLQTAAARQPKQRVETRMTKARSWQAFIHPT